MTRSILEKTVTFLKVSNSQEKIKAICSTVEQHFLKGETILLLAPTEEAANYLDQLLWRIPEAGFLPHAVVREKSQERIAIVTVEENFNQATVLISLLPQVSFLWQQFTDVYELLDGTQPD